MRLSRYGSASGLQRYRCNRCRKTFNALTGTPLARLRHKPKWPGYLAALAESKTVRQSTAEAGVHRNTRFRWRHRFLAGIGLDRPGALEGITEADETYLLESDKGKRNLSRKPRKRGGNARQRGLSNGQAGILVARDRPGHPLDFVTGNGQLTKTRLSDALKPVLATDALLVSDSNPTYQAFCRAEGISFEPSTSAKASGPKGLTTSRTSMPTTAASSGGWTAFMAWPPTIYRTISVGGGFLNSTATQPRNGYSMPHWGIFNN